MFTTALVIATLTSGIQLNQQRVVLWVVAGIACFGISQPKRAVRDLALHWSPLFVSMWVYARLRGSAEELTGRSHLGPHLNFDQLIGGGIVPSERLQHAFYVPGHPHAWDYVTWLTYSSHFVMPLAIGVLLWRTSHDRFAPYILSLAVLSYCALITYALYPARPPWMASQEGVIGHTVRVVHDMWREVGVQRAAAVFSTRHVNGEHPYGNPVAALPSLHAAFPMLIMLALRGVSRWLTTLLAAYVVLMGLALVYAGEHYVFDVLMGWAYAWGVWRIVAVLVERWRARERGGDRHGSDAAADGAGSSGAR